MQSLLTCFVVLGPLLFANTLAWSPTDPGSISRRDALSAPVPPSQDPFYTPPPYFEYSAPGAVLRIREAPGNLTDIVVNSSKAYHIVYRTTDSLYKPAWAVTTLFVPKKPLPHDQTTTSPSTNPTAQKNALLSYQIPYNTPDVDGSPSYGLYNIFAEGSIGLPPTTDDIAGALGLGWYVVVPDFEGPQAAFFAGPQEGHAVIDSVRAVYATDLVPLSPANTRAALWGYSGGSIASGFAAELAPAYAPELALAGVALGGLVPNVTQALGYINKQPYAGLLVSVLLGVTAQEPWARNFLVGKLKTEGPYNATGFLAALHMPITEIFAAYPGQDISDYFVDGWALLEDPKMKALLGKNAYAGRHGVPQTPVFAYKAIGDEFSNVTESDRLIESWCELGVDVLYQRNTIGGHVTENINGKPRAMAWLSSVLDGKYSASGCTWQDVTVNLTASVA
ncbi:LIP-domain-containing protein [Whalleya microplaca]|nr:LIP-domain-containing protein [Whalleya microplaca]